MTDSTRRALVAQACIDFGVQILRLRQVSADEAREAAKTLYTWFSSRDAFAEGNHSIALQCTIFGRELLDSRKTSTLKEAIDSIQDLYAEMRA